MIQLSDLFKIEQHICPLCFPTRKYLHERETFEYIMVYSCSNRGCHFHLSVFKHAKVLQLDLKKYALLIRIDNGDSRYQLLATTMPNKSNILIDNLIIQDFAFKSFDELEQYIQTLINFT